MISFLSARRLHNNLGWLIESSDFLMCTSQLQVSSLVPLKAPYITHGYWDDITLAGVLSAQANGRLMVIGSGMGSFLPSLAQLADQIQVCAIDMNASFLEISRRVAERLGFSERLTLVNEDALRGIAKTNDKFNGVFVDLYSAEGVLPLAGEARLHQGIQSVLRDDGLVWINIADRLFDSDYVASATKYFVDRVLPLYGHGLFLRRKASTTAVFSRVPTDSWQVTIEAAMAAHPEAWPSDRIQVLKPKSLSQTLSTAALEFSQQKSQAQGLNDGADGYFKECLLAIQNLSPLDLIRLSRAPSALLGDRL